jgi:hypothetical protein
MLAKHRISESCRKDKAARLIPRKRNGGIRPLRAKEGLEGPYNGLTGIRRLLRA